MSRQSLSLSQARRVALAAQGFNKQRPTRVTRRHIRDTVRKLGLLQLDFVNVLVPAHLFVLYSRLGSYDREHFTEVIYDSPDFIEHWAHEASIVPVECWPLLEYRRQSYKPWPNSPIMKIKGKERYLESALDTVRDNGPILSNDLPSMEGPKRKSGDWHRSVPRWALEVHFGQGNVSVAGRLPNFQRLYDLPEKVVAEPHFSSKIAAEEAYRQLLAIAARGHGVATLQDLAD